jgi:WD40 repeat protein
LGVATIDDFPVDISWSATNDAFVVAGGEGRLYRIERGSDAAVLIGTHEPGLLAAAWQPGRPIIATSGQDGGVRWWDLTRDGVVGSDDDVGDADNRGVNPPRLVHRGRNWPAGLAWRADGKRLAFATARVLHVLDETGQSVSVLDAHTVNLSHLVWRGRDEIVAVGNGALFLDRIDGDGKMEQFVLEGTPQTLSLSPDMKIVASGLADGIVNFRYLNLNKRSRMDGYEGKVDQTTWSANSRLLATASSGASAIIVWDFGGKGPEGGEPLQLEAHDERIGALVWQPGGPHLISAARDWKLALWRPGPGSKRPLDVQRLEGEPALARWSPDGKWLAVAESGGRIRCYALKV